MLEHAVDSSDATPLGLDDPLAPARSMLMMLQSFAPAETGDIAMRSRKSADQPYSLAERYAAANSITRRRFDAVLREAELAGSAGLRLIIARGGKSDPATIAAALFLGNMIGATIRKLEHLLPPQLA